MNPSMMQTQVKELWRHGINPCAHFEADAERTRWWRREKFELCHRYHKVLGYVMFYFHRTLGPRTRRAELMMAPGQKEPRSWSIISHLSDLSPHVQWPACTKATFSIWNERDRQHVGHTLAMTIGARCKKEAEIGEGAACVQPTAAVVALILKAVPLSRDRRRPASHDESRIRHVLVAPLVRFHFICTHFPSPLHRSPSCCRWGSSPWPKAMSSGRWESLRIPTSRMQMSSEWSRRAPHPIGLHSIASAKIPFSSGILVFCPSWGLAAPRWSAGNPWPLSWTKVSRTEVPRACCMDSSSSGSAVWPFSPRWPNWLQWRPSPAGSTTGSRWWHQPIPRGFVVTSKAGWPWLVGKDFVVVLHFCPPNCFKR